MVSFVFALAIFVHILIRPPSRLAPSSYATVMVTLTFTFLLSSPPLPVINVWPVIADTAALQTMFLPVVELIVEVPHLEETSLVDGVLAFIRWDLVFGLGSVILTTFWMADSLLLSSGCLFGITSQPSLLALPLRLLTYSCYRKGDSMDGTKRRGYPKRWNKIFSFDMYSTIRQRCNVWRCRTSSKPTILSANYA